MGGPRRPRPRCTKKTLTRHRHRYKFDVAFHIGLTASKVRCAFQPFSASYVSVGSGLVPRRVYLVAGNRNTRRHKSPGNAAPRYGSRLWKGVPCVDARFLSPERARNVYMWEAQSWGQSSIHCLSRLAPAAPRSSCRAAKFNEENNCNAVRSGFWSTFSFV